MAVASLAVLPDGRMLVPLTAVANGHTAGIECSADGGMTWHVRC